jgi:hypothetical protein
VDPATQPHPLSDVRLPQCPAAVSAPGCPNHPFPRVYAPPLSASHRTR